MILRNSLRFNWCKISNAQNIYLHNKAIRTMRESVMLLHRSLKDVVLCALWKDTETDGWEEVLGTTISLWQECAQNENWLANLDPYIKLCISCMPKLINWGITVFFIIRRHLFQFHNEVNLNFVLKSSHTPGSDTQTTRTPWTFKLTHVNVTLSAESTQCTQKKSQAVDKGWSSSLGGWARP
jgi:hypothetical protein